LKGKISSLRLAVASDRRSSIYFHADLLVVGNLGRSVTMREAIKTSTASVIVTSADSKQNWQK